MDEHITKRPEKGDLFRVHISYYYAGEMRTVTATYRAKAQGSGKNFDWVRLVPSKQFRNVNTGTTNMVLLDSQRPVMKMGAQILMPFHHWPVYSRGFLGAFKDWEIDTVVAKPYSL